MSQSIRITITESKVPIFAIAILTVIFVVGIFVVGFDEHQFGGEVVCGTNAPEGVEV